MFADEIKMRFSEWGTGALRLFPAEFAHQMGLGLLHSGALRLLAPYQELDPSIGLWTSLAGKKLNHPIGLAAGFDKNAEVLSRLTGMNFSFGEVGTVTPRPQEGNPKPRLFRLKEQHAIINRMGFNNAGSGQVLANVKRQKSSLPSRFLLGINVGKNKLTPNDKAILDYISMLKYFGGQEDFFVINISSPNTPGLRALATPSFLQELASEIESQLSYKPKVYVKLDPDMNKSEFQSLVASVQEMGYGGLVLTNTQKTSSPEKGGLSGSPLLVASCRFLEWAYEVHQGRLEMIGSGGAMTGQDVYEKIVRGATVVEIYTAMIYRGPLVVSKMLKELQICLRSRGFQTLEEARGSHY